MTDTVPLVQAPNNPTAGVIVGVHQPPPAYPSGTAGELIDYRQKEGLSEAEWKRETYFNLCSLCCNFFIVCLYMLIFGMGLMIDNVDANVDISIYTQAIDEWSKPGYSQFKWSSGFCTEGWEPIGNTWLGTVEGNQTSNGVEVTDSDYDGDIPPSPSVFQYEFYTDMTEKICGKLADYDYSYANATRVNMDPETQTWTCPDDLVPCSTNTELGGSTLCVPQTVKSASCQVTDFAILDEDSTDPRLSDPYYTSILSGGISPKYMVFTSGSENQRSNAPLHDIRYEFGEICAWPDQSNIFDVDPYYYPLEKSALLDECRDYLKTSEDDQTTTAIDTRYSAISLVSDLPDEYDIQRLSGVYDTLTRLPFFDQYVPFPITEKSAKKYDLWARTTLEFDPECEKSITDAIQTLKDINDSTLNEYLNKVLWIIAVSFAGVILIYMIVNTFCLFKTRQRVRVCFRVNTVVYSSIFLAFSGCMLGLVIANYTQLGSRYSGVQDWSEYGSCVDSLMQVPQYQLDQVDTSSTGTIVQLVTAIVIFVLQAVLFAGNLKFQCRGICC